jgi:hypothetical protein
MICILLGRKLRRCLEACKVWGVPMGTLKVPSLFNLKPYSDRSLSQNVDRIGSSRKNIKYIDVANCPMEM